MGASQFSELSYSLSEFDRVIYLFIFKSADKKG